MIISKKKKFTKGQWALLIMAGLGVLFLLVFNYAPMYGIVLAFKDGDYKMDIRKAIFESDWVQWRNFEKFLVDPQFKSVLMNTLGLNMLSLIITFPAPIIFALLINEIRNRKVTIQQQQVSNIPLLVLALWKKLY